MTKGFFVSFEGNEGAGKSTLIEALYKKLNDLSFSVIKTLEPGGTAIGDAIRDILLFSEDISPFCELALFLASRAEHVEKVIIPAIDKNKIVLCDRFSDSTIAYQGIARGLGEKKVEDLCLIFSKSLKPDITLYLDIDPEIGLKRCQRTEKDRIENEKIDFHRLVRKAFLALAEKNPKRVHVLDATKTPDELFEMALKLILRSI